MLVLFKPASVATRLAGTSVHAVDHSHSILIRVPLEANVTYLILKL